MLNINSERFLYAKKWNNLLLASDQKYLVLKKEKKKNKTDENGLWMKNYCQ